MKYPTDMVTDDGWTRIHCGHNLDRDMLRADLASSQGEPSMGALSITECNLRYLPRLKWCGDYGGCDLEGEWHAHWVPVQPNRPESAVTVVRWVSQ